jgi:hypothetical protein
MKARATLLARYQQRVFSHAAIRGSLTPYLKAVDDRRQGTLGK